MLLMGAIELFFSQLPSLEGEQTTFRPAAWSSDPACSPLTTCQDGLAWHACCCTQPGLLLPANPPLHTAFLALDRTADIWWVSALGTASSLLYVFIALILGLIYSGNHLGSVGGRAGSSTSQKIFGIFSSLGNIAFAFGEWKCRGGGMLGLGLWCTSAAPLLPPHVGAPCTHPHPCQPTAVMQPTGTPASLPQALPRCYLRFRTPCASRPTPRRR